ncbi:MAG TPA: hypothetical protein PLO51_05650 [Candidatus Micrarchaeota archaeon]|nr:hypothetical protein [Candidatus Micrarchaeota archaeon]
MPKSPSYTNEEILLALIWSMPKKMTKGQIGRLLGIKSAGQKHWRERLESLAEKKLISIEKLDAGELFFGSPILKYYINEKNLEEIWSQYFVNYNGNNGHTADPFLTPFSAGIWNVTSTPEFSKLVGSRFNYNFLCAKNEANPTKPKKKIELLDRDKRWKMLDAVLSIGWKTEAYQRKPVLMATLNREQKKTYKAITSIYDEQAKAHPSDYKKFTALFEEDFKYYL